MQIRRALLEDREKFVKAYLLAYKELSDYKYRSSKEIKNYFNWLYKRDREGFWVAEEQNEVLGFVASDANWIGVEGEEVLEIHELFVIPEARNKGIGKKLLEKALKYGKEKDKKLVELWVGEKNFQAINFYKSLGFKENGVVGKWLRMTKSLNC
ncbi:MAG: GNAT family N-acetyltransferase [Thermodesulfobacteriaceae bacterium]|nr:GNAT family N-acetyltransferase [Thermodesulfobacteriaceae bacterium]MCX8040864.1 GNAT family N-acetyltransferase [Thermodesulfobacteriaceae bacterium]MDW8136266.1 GNAT family N-acetyltransferase [Thermodesulfobacterium sp.]